ncbi:MAG: hypothetical protein E7509_06645 [Ruminococcus sp.]|nr:hypothetical protein [Ruminococcus sp.]
MVNLKKKYVNRIIIALLIVFIVLGITFIILNNAIKEHYEEIASQEGIKVSAKILSNCISDVISSQNHKINNVINVIYGSDEEIISIETDAGTVNEIQLEILQKVNIELSDTNKNSSQIPIGTLTDMPFLVGEGPDISIKYSQQGSATVELESEFVSGGLNQTVHRLYAHVETEIYSVSPIKSEITDFSFDYLLSETVIVGEVPEKISSIY